MVAPITQATSTTGGTQAPSAGTPRNSTNVFEGENKIIKKLCNALKNTAEFQIDTLKLNVIWSNCYPPFIMLVLARYIVMWHNNKHRWNKRLNTTPIWNDQEEKSGTGGEYFKQQC